MAELLSDYEEVIQLLKNPGGGFLQQPMAHDGFRMPTKGEAGLYHLHQVRIRWENNREGDSNPVIMLDLYKGERVSEDQVPDELDPVFRAYAKEGRFDLRGRGTVKTVTADSGHALWPNAYRLKPTLPEACWSDPEQATIFLKKASRAITNEPRTRIELRLDLVQAAWRGHKLVTQTLPGKFPAAFYQRRATEAGDELWVGRLPSNYDRLKLDEKGKMDVRDSENGVTVCLAPEFMRNLLFIIEHVTLRHMRFLWEAYWGK